MSARPGGLDPGPDPYIHGDTIHGIFQWHADRQPAAPALLYSGEVITYGDLRGAAYALAARFAASGLTPGCFVVVKMRRSPAFAAALLAVLRLGGAYLAAEQAWSRQYVQDLLDRADAWLVTDEPGAGLTSRHGTLVVAADALPHDLSAPEPQVAVGRDDPCTIFQTSGSTGSPKLAVVPHRATVRAFIGADYADFGPGRVIMQTSPVCWDGLTMELWSVLLSGGTSLIPPDGVPVSGDLLRSCSASYGLDTVWLTSSLFSALVDDDIEAFADIRQVMSGGERVSADHVRRLRAAHPGIRFSSGYGPVETTVFATSHVIADGDTELYGEVPLGRPLPATTVLLLDEAGDACPPGATGEIYVGGDAVGLGYLGDPSETRQRFVAISGQGCFYRTGDLGQWHEAGALLFRGRVDRQVKIRGHRVEPEGVERYISEALPGVVAAVTPWLDGHGQVIGLVAHCGTGGRAVTAADISQACEAGLPPRLRPRRILLYGELPRNDNGKVNYDALAAVELAAPVTGPIEVDHPHAGSAQDRITEIASALLGMPVGPADDLFELGGDSLFAMRLAARLRREAGIRLPVGRIHRERTAARLAQVDITDRNERARPDDAQKLGPGEQDLCVHEEIFPGDQALLLPSAYELSSDIDLTDLRAAITLTCTRHPALGSIRITGADAVRRHQLPADQVRRELRIHDLEHEIMTDDDGAVIFPAEWLTPFDLTRDLPLRIFVATGPSGSRLLCLVIHHVAMDGWSEHLFSDDLARAYDDVAAGTPASSPLPGSSASAPLASSAAEREQSRTYWRALLDGLRPLPIEQAYSGSSVLGQVRGWLTGEQCRALAQLSGGSDDLHSGALAWYADALKHAFSRDDFAIGSAYAARDLTDDETIGYHVQMIPLRINYPEDKEISAVAADISAQWLASLDQRSLSLREIAACAPSARQRGHRPVFQAGFALQSNPRSSLRLAGRIQSRLEVRPPAPPFELYLELWPESGRGAVVLLQWNTGSVLKSVPERLAERLRASIQALH